MEEQGNERISFSLFNSLNAHFYGLTYRNKVSQIRSVTREEALEFVEDNNAQNQAAITVENEFFF